MNGHANCILAVCCPPGSDNQRAALAEEMAIALSNPPSSESAVIISREKWDRIAGWVLKNFDLAPAGSLQPFKDAIAKLARENS